MTIEDQLYILRSQIEDLTELVQIIFISLDTKKAVSKFLNKSEKTIDNYIKNKTFIENEHYFFNEREKIEFIPMGILRFKKNPNYKIKIIEEKKEEKITLSETSSKILRGIL